MYPLHDICNDPFVDVSRLLEILFASTLPDACDEQMIQFRIEFKLAKAIFSGVLNSRLPSREVVCGHLIVSSSLQKEHWSVQIFDLCKWIVLSQIEIVRWISSQY